MELVYLAHTDDMIADFAELFMLCDSFTEFFFTAELALIVQQYMPTHSVCLPLQHIYSLLLRDHVCHYAHPDHAHLLHKIYN